MNDEADEVRPFEDSIKNRYQNNLESMKGKVVSFSLIMFIYCIINVIK